jgi:hypothetical protein
MHQQFMHDDVCQGVIERAFVTEYMAKGSFSDATCSGLDMKVHPPTPPAHPPAYLTCSPCMQLAKVQDFIDGPQNLAVGLNKHMSATTNATSPNKIEAAARVAASKLSHWISVLLFGGHNATTVLIMT